MTEGRLRVYSAVLWSKMISMVKVVSVVRYDSDDIRQIGGKMGYQSDDPEFNRQDKTSLLSYEHSGSL